MNAQSVGPSYLMANLLIEPADPRRPILDALDRLAEALAPVAAKFSIGQPAGHDLIETLSECIEQTTANNTFGGFLKKKAESIREHSRRTAFAAQAIGQATSQRLDVPVCFLAGLLHDIGKLALLGCVPRSYQRVCSLQFATGNELKAEREFLGLDHTFAGRLLALGWEMPKPITDSIGLHHTASAALPFMTEHFELVRVIQVANALAKSTYEGIPSLPPFADSAAAQLGLAPEVLTKVGEELRGLEFKGSLIPLDFAKTNAGHSLNEGQFPSVTRPGIHRFDASMSLGVNERRSSALLAEFAESIHTAHRMDLACLRVAEAARVLYESPWACCIYFPRRTGAGWVLRNPRDHTSVHTGAWPREAVESLRGLLVHSTNCADSTSLPSGLAERLIPSNLAQKVRLIPLGVIDDGLAGLTIACGTENTEPTRNWEPDDSGVRAMLASALAVAAKQLATEVDKERAALSFEQGLGLSRPARGSAAQSMIAELAAGAAHELNNPLAVISGRAQMELRDATDPNTSKSLQTIVDQANKATGLISELMDFAKPRAPIPAQLMLANLLHSVVRRRSGFSALPEGAIKVTLADSQATLFADPGQIDRAIDAILSNAIAACAKGAVGVEINSPSRASDEKVRIVIEDRGTGMTPYVLEHATIPFYSQRPAGRGRGLGLSLATRLIELNGGSWRIDSRPGTGTRVSITLPARQGE